MGMKPCRKPYCKNLTSKVYCSECEVMKQAGRGLSGSTRKPREATPYDSFYHTRAWKKCREVVLMRDNYLCQYCLSENKIVLADIVHHIINYEECPDRGLDLANLTSVCRSCHSKVHVGE